MRVVAWIIAAIVLLAAIPLWPIVGLIWGAWALRSVKDAGDSKRRGLAIGSIVGSLAMAGVVWPGLFSGSEVEEIAATTTAATATATPEASSASPSRAVSPAASPSVAVATTPVASATRASAPTTTAATTKAAGAEVPAVALVPVAGVVDGDTIKVRIDGRTETVRVIGIDAPELAGAECYSQQSSSRMQSLVQSRSVRLEMDPTQADRDRYGRLLRHVHDADGRSVAEALIAGGFGREYTYAADYRYQDRYRVAERSARSAGKGIWSSGCAEKPVPVAEPKRTTESATNDKPARIAAQAPASSGGCTIKGNINTKTGEKIYHVPGGRSYNKTKIDLSKGERWFCNTADAEQAGWRAARG